MREGETGEPEDAGDTVTREDRTGWGFFRADGVGLVWNVKQLVGMIEGKWQQWMNQLWNTYTFINIIIWSNNRISIKNILD